ncbi:signal peptidase II [Terriglobus aquaticus]|uniref:Lipoprotein signal peptidase n=1 Tax=Terriglobus aquaticus TaxID=940139 RepID=A0ABW9KLP1_9BACT|nr:signal peptidase II [Terriglobus aquaticus]
MIDERNQERVLLDPGATHVETDRTGATYLVQRDARPWLLLLSLIAVLVDRLTKLYVVAHLQTGQAVTVIPHVFRITHVLNFGAAFSMFAESASPEAVRWSLVVFSLVAAVIVFAMLWRMGRVFSPAAVGLALILGGAIGNLYDRMKLHYVIDFLEVHIVHYHWPDFNVADSCITVGAVLILIELLWPKQKQTHMEDATVVR